MLTVRLKLFHFIDFTKCVHARIVAITKGKANFFSPTKPRILVQCRSIVVDVVARLFHRSIISVQLVEYS